MPTDGGWTQRVGGMSGRNFEALEGTFRFDVEHVFAGDTYAAVVTHNTAEATGQSLGLLW
jgi:hypothetical protein